MMRRVLSYGVMRAWCVVLFVRGLAAYSDRRLSLCVRSRRKAMVIAWFAVPIRSWWCAFGGAWLVTAIRCPFFRNLFSLFLPSLHVHWCTDPHAAMRGTDPPLSFVASDVSWRGVWHGGVRFDWCSVVNTRADRSFTERSGEDLSFYLCD